VSNNQFEAAETRFAQYRRAAGSQVASTNAPSTKVPSSNASPSASVSSPTLVAALRAAPVATPTPALMVKQPHASPTPKQPVAAATPANRPTASPTPTAPAVAETTPQPFLAASPSPGTGNRIGSWQLFKPGLMPRGRLFDVRQSAELADKGIGTEPIYLKGEFTVTAARENRAVLRPKSESSNAPGASIRIIVEFPKGGNVPKEGDPVARLNDRPFQIEDVRKGADGQVNIYVREITVE
jgi:hypothetical protein